MSDAAVDEPQEPQDNVGDGWARNGYAVVSVEDRLYVVKPDGTPEHIAQFNTKEDGKRFLQHFGYILGDDDHSAVAEFIEAENLEVGRSH